MVWLKSSYSMSQRDIILCCPIHKIPLILTRSNFYVLTFVIDSVFVNCIYTCISGNSCPNHIFQNTGSCSKCSCACMYVALLNRLLKNIHPCALMRRGLHDNLEAWFHWKECMDLAKTPFSQLFKEDFTSGGAIFYRSPVIRRLCSY